VQTAAASDFQVLLELEAAIIIGDAWIGLTDKIPAKKPERMIITQNIPNK
jgi:F0F1-type ATP synthase assembly protein I